MDHKAIDISSPSKALGEVKVGQAGTIDDSSWIWVKEPQLVASRPFRTITIGPTSKVARFALCQVTADNDYTFYVNGKLIGSNPGNGDWWYGQMWYTDLAERVNVFAFNVTNTGAQAGLLVACRIFYSDGTIDTLLTDGNWNTVNASPPANFQSPYFFEDDAWVKATNEGRYGVPPWNKGIIMPLFPPVIGLDGTAAWIWASRVIRSPSEIRPFRYTFTVPKGKTAKHAIILTTADNDFSLFVNGNLLGYGTNWGIGNRYVVPISGSPVVFAMAAHMISTPQRSDAGIIARIQIIYSDGTYDIINSGESWKSLNDDPPAGFEGPSFDDSAWPAAVVIGAYGVPPWNTGVVIPPI